LQHIQVVRSLVREFERLIQTEIELKYPDRYPASSVFLEEKEKYLLDKFEKTNIMGKQECFSKYKEVLAKTLKENLAKINEINTIKINSVSIRTQKARAEASRRNEIIKIQEAREAAKR